MYRLALDALAKDADALFKRTCERSVMLHAKFREAAHGREELEGLLLLSRKEETGEEGGKTVAEYERRLSRMVKLEKHYATLSNQADTLLAQLSGKLNVHISGSVHHKHTPKGEAVAVPAAA